MIMEDPIIFLRYFYRINVILAITFSYCSRYLYSCSTLKDFDLHSALINL